MLIQVLSPNFVIPLFCGIILLYAIHRVRRRSTTSQDSASAVHQDAGKHSLSSDKSGRENVPGGKQCFTAILIITFHISCFVVWEPVDFSFPGFPPCKERLHDRKPSPYRPFRWGNYKYVSIFLIPFTGI